MHTKSTSWGLVLLACLFLLAGEGVLLAAEKKAKGASKPADGSLKTWSVTLPKTGTASGVTPTPDGGCVVVGSRDGEGLFAARLGRNGNTVWYKTYGPKGYLADASQAVDVVATPDGGFAMAGHRVIKGPSEAPFVRKLDKDGNLRWERLFQEGKGDVSRGLSISLLSDGGFLLAGKMTGTVEVNNQARTLTWRKPGGTFVARLDGNGNVLWQQLLKARTAHFEGYEKYNHAVPLADGILVVTSFARFNGERGIEYPNGIRLTKLSMDGTPLWETEDDGTLFAGAVAVGLVPAGKTRAVITGRSNNLKKAADTFRSGSAFALEVSEDGAWGWKRLFGRVQAQGFGGDNYPFGVAADVDGGFLVYGMTQASWSKARFGTAWMVKLDRQGVPQWDRIFGKAQVSSRWNAVAAAPDGGILAVGYLAGTGDCRPWVVKLSGQGKGIPEIIETGESRFQHTDSF